MNGRSHVLGSRIRQASALLLMSALAGCSFGADGADGAKAPLESNRPQTDKYFSAIVKLETAPLLQTAQPSADGTMVIDGDAASKIAREQATLLAELQKRSPEVKVLYRYRLVLNAVAILAPVALKEQIRGLAGIASIDEATAIAPPSFVAEADAQRTNAFVENSVAWIGATKARRELGLTGRGMKVGVIDTGVDYTHKMFGGPGTAQAFSSNDGAVIEPGTFPTRRIVGGMDFVGKDFDASSIIEAKRIPQPDNDPLDEHGHGSHVAGTIGGIGDGVNTYDGVAPEAELYALKVFGKGSTSEGVVIAALEYAADPNGDGDLSDRLDVVNLSLGSGWGTRLGLYDEAVTSLSRGGTFFVAAAGNSGPTRYIVGSPSTSDNALSVAASTDNSVASTPADLLAGFSSWGPRSIDGALKPEITAPGSRIISAQMGGGDRGTPKSGTSMASPHVAGVAALLRQAHPKASPAELKSLLMNTGVGTKDRDGVPYAISKIGGGRVQTFEAALSPLVFDPPSISLGIVAANAVSHGTKSIKVTNLSDARVRANVSFRASRGFSLSGASSLDVPAGGSANLEVEYDVDVRSADVVETEVEGQAILALPAHANVPALTLAVPALAVATRGSEIALTGAPLASGPVSLPLVNKGPIAGEVLAFASLGRDEVGTNRNGLCDLSSAGYRIVRRQDASGAKDLLQFGFSLASPLSTWHFCELSVLVDENGDGVAEQEIAGTFDSDLRPENAAGDPFGTFLVDSPKMRSIRARIEQGQAAATDYPQAVLDQQPYVRFPHSSVAYISADLAKLRRTANGKLRVKVAVLAASAGAVSDDHLGDAGGQWIELDPAAIPFTKIDEAVSMPASSSSTLNFTSSGRSSNLVVYLPQNSVAAGRNFIVGPGGQTTLIP